MDPKQTLSPAAYLIVNATFADDPRTWDLADTLDASDERVEVLASATEADIDAALAFIRAKFVKGVADAKEMVADM